MEKWEHGNMETGVSPHSQAKVQPGNKANAYAGRKSYISHVLLHLTSCKLSFLKLVELHIKQQYKEITSFMSMETENKQTRVSCVSYIRGSSWST